jgi:alpha-glucuronidase
MMASRETAVDYMTPLGLNLIMAHGTHHGPGPWDMIGPREDWKAPYYHHAGPDGIGFDRTSSGSDQAAQYKSPLKEQLENAATTPEKFLLWFHHLPWDYRLADGLTLWDALVMRYFRGVEEVAAAQKVWAGLAKYVDEARYHQTTDFLAIEHREAIWWRDGCLAYFAQIAKHPFPAGYPAPKHPLAYYENTPIDASPDP